MKRKIIDLFWVFLKMDVELALKLLLLENNSSPSLNGNPAVIVSQNTLKIKGAEEDISDS